MSDKSEYVEVYDLKSKINRTVTRAAYKIIGPRRYQLLNEQVEAPQSTVQKKSVPVAAPAEVKPEQTPSENVEETQPTVQETSVEALQEGVSVVRRKPGPKPKQKLNG